MHEHLKNCPFCGGNARKVKHSAGSPGTTGYDRWHGVACAGCNACVGARDRRFRTSAAAIAAWNTRTPQPTHAQAGAVPPIECNTEELKRAYAFGWWSALEKQREALHAGAVLNKHPPEDVCGWSYRMGIDDAELHHGIKGGQHGAK